MFDDDLPYPPKPRREYAIVWLTLAAGFVVAFIAAKIWA